MASSRHRLSLRVAALTLSAIGAVLMGGGGPIAAAVVTRVDHAEHADHGRVADHDRGRDRDREGDRDREHERSHATRDHGSHGSSHHDHDRVPGAPGHLIGSDTRTQGCDDTASGDTNCPGDRGADRGSAQRASGVATGPAPAATPAPVNGGGDAARSAGRPAPPHTETTTTTTTSTSRTVSAGAAASALPTSGAGAPVVVPVTGAEGRIGIGLLLWLAGLVGLVLARRR